MFRENLVGWIVRPERECAARLQLFPQQCESSSGVKGFSLLIEKLVGRVIYVEQYRVKLTLII